MMKIENQSIWAVSISKTDPKVRYRENVECVVVAATLEDAVRLVREAYPDPDVQIWSANTNRRNATFILPGSVPELAP